MAGEFPSKMGNVTDTSLPAGVELEALRAQGQAKLWELTLGVITSMAIKAAVLLDIPGIISKRGSNALSSLDDIAKGLPGQNIDKGYLSRLLRFLACRGILSEVKQLTSSRGTDRCYGINEVSMWLVGENSMCMAPRILMQLDKALTEPLHYLHQSVLEGQSPLRIAHGEDIWEYASRHPDLRRLIDDSTACNSRLTLSALLENYDGFKGNNTLVDVGGGVGLVLSMIVARYPQIRGINYDLPEVVVSAPAILGVDHVAGNMFESVPRGDVIILKSILHDWNDSDCIKILKNCWTSLPTNGKLIILDAVLDSTEDITQARAQISDMLMLVTTDGSVERGKDEWVDLFIASGFGKHHFTRFSSNLHLWVMEVYKC